MAKTKRKSNVPFKEWVWYLIASIFAAWGLAEVICGLIIEYAGAGVTKWPLYEANVKYTQLFGLSFLHWGLILLAIGTIVGVIVLCITAATYDRESEKQSRRAARLHMKKQEEVVEAKVEEPAKAEEPAKQENATAEAPKAE